MDPYLELRALFPDLHDGFVVMCSEAIQSRLPEPYFSAIGSRVGVDVPHDEFRETFVEIYSRREHERLVTVVELLSHSNKAPGEKGRELYLRKQRELLDSQTHLVEIDLLRAGEHSTAVPLDHLRRRCGEFDYHVCMHQFHHFEDFLVYPYRLEDTLPEIGVPLLPGDGGVAVDLQVVFNRCYDAGPCRRRVRYRDTTPEPPLGEPRAAWAKHHLEAWHATL